MSLSIAIGLYVVIWWVVLFAVLPLGIKTQEESGEVVPGTPTSAPVMPRLARKLVLTTLIATLVFAAVWAVIAYRLIDLDRIPYGL